MREVPVQPQPVFHLNKIVLRPLASFSRVEDPSTPKSLWLLRLLCKFQPLPSGDHGYHV